MSRSAPRVVVIAAADEPDPPVLEPVADAADLEIVRTRDALASALADADVLAVYDFNTRLVREVGAQAATVDWIHAASAGVDAVLTPAVVEAPTVVTNARGVFEAPMAEWVIAVLLLFAKDLRTTLDLQAAHEWRHRESDSLAGRRLLVVGAGSVGGAVGRLGRALGMEVSGVASRRRDDPDIGRVFGPDDLHAQLAGADDVVVCAPLTDQTRDMFDADAFACMRFGARFVNVGRGPIVDETALLDALRSGRVGAAALDVFVDEPLPADHPFWDMDQVVVSPHMSGDVEGWRRALGGQFAANFARWQRGENLENVVDKERIAHRGAGA